MKDDSISESLGETLIKSDLTNISKDVLETILDKEIFENGFLKDIPIVNSIVGAGKTVSSIRDYLFTKKILGFLNGLASISLEKRQKMISKVDSNPTYRQSVGSKLIFIIDQTQDSEVAGIISKLFVAFLEGELTYREFCKSSLIVNRIDIIDLEDFLELPDDAYGQNGTQDLGLEELDNFLINAGLCTAETDEVTVEDQDDWKSNEQYKVTGGVTRIYRTLIGTKIYNILIR